MELKMLTILILIMMVLKTQLTQMMITMGSRTKLRKIAYGSDPYNANSVVINSPLPLSQRLQYR